MAASTSSKDKLLKILCLHGYRQNGQTFRERTGAFRKIIKKYAELVFIDAPNKVPPLEEACDEAGGDNAKGQGQVKPEELGWWFSREDDYYRAQDATDCDKGYGASLDTVKQAFAEHGPFDGMLAFSQGAALLSLICALQERGEWEGGRFDFAVLVSGFRSRSCCHTQLYTTTMTLPTLHVFGETDRVIEAEMSEELLENYRDPVVLRHPGGHFVPAAGPQKAVYLEFLTSVLRRRGEGEAAS